MPYIMWPAQQKLVMQNNRKVVSGSHFYSNGTEENQKLHTSTFLLATNFGVSVSGKSKLKEKERVHIIVQSTHQCSRIESSMSDQPRDHPRRVLCLCRRVDIVIAQMYGQPSDIPLRHTLSETKHEISAIAF